MRRDTRGIIFITGLWVLTGLVVLGGAALTRSWNELTLTRRVLATQQAFYLAEAGLDEALAWLRAQPSPPPLACSEVPPAPLCQPFDPFGGARTLPSGAYTVTIDPLDTNPTETISYYTIRSEATAAGIPVTRALSYTVRTENFARFQLFSNVGQTVEGIPATSLGGNRVYQGPIHTNYQFSITGEGVAWGGSPTFQQLVSSASSSAPSCSYPPCNPQYQQGLALGVPVIPMPAGLGALTTQSLLLPGDTTIAISGETLSITNSALGWTNVPVSVATTPAVLVQGGTLTLNGGTLDGQVTLASDSDIRIMGSITYACDAATPATDPDCLDGTGQVAYNDDMLGLVALNSVRVPRAAPYDLTVYGAVMAIQGGYYAEEWWVNELKGTFTSFGSISSDNARVFGSILIAVNDPNTWMPWGGYHGGGFSYDPRLQSRPPPHFPPTGRYEAVDWRDP